jgi:hypothetical protein
VGCIHNVEHFHQVTVLVEYITLASRIRGTLDVGTDDTREIKCYGSYILPVLLVFGVLVIGLSLVAVGWKKGWFG